MSRGCAGAAAETAAARLAAFRAMALDRLLWLATGAAVLSLGALVAARLSLVSALFGLAQVAALFGLALARRIPYRARAWGFVVVGTAASWLALPLLGFSAASLINGLLSVFLAALLLGIRAGAVVGTLFVGGLIGLVWLPPSLLQAGALHVYRVTEMQWFQIAVAGAYFVAQVVVGLSIVIRSLERGFGESLELVRTLEESERRFRGLFEAGPDVMALTEKASGTLVDVNPGFERLLGWARAEAVGRTLSELGVMPPEVRGRFVERVEASGLVERVELELRRRDGVLLVSEVSARVTTIDGRALLLVVARDVTHERQLTAAVRHAQRVEAMGSLAAGIAHNFRNALGAVVPNLTMALEDAPAELRPLLEDAQHSAAAAVELASDLTRMARRQDDGPRESVDVGGIVREVAAIARRTFGARFEVRERVEEGLPRTMGRTSQLHQVLLNLCINARDAMEKTAKPRIVLEATRSARAGVELVVADNGCGMAPEVLQHAGEPFFTTKPEGHGTGLGLSTAFAIVRDSGGRMTVSSHVGEGTTFRIQLPEVGEEASGLGAAPAAPMIGLGGWVLLVDDDERTLASLVQQIEGLGIEVDGFSDPLAARAQLERQPQRYRVLLTDLDMPALGGVELAARARQVNGSISVVILTGAPDARRPPETAAVLLKPVSMPDLALTLERCLGLSPTGGKPRND